MDDWTEKFCEEVEDIMRLQGSLPILLRKLVQSLRIVRAQAAVIEAHECYGRYGALPGVLDNSLRAGRELAKLKEEING